MSKKYYDNFVQHTIYFEPSTYNTIKILASKKKQSTTETVRILLESGINHELLANNTNSIAKILTPILKEISRTDNERLAKLIIKTMKASAAGIYLTMQAIEDIGQNKGSHRPHG
ncbi:MAG: hypothetical protein DDT32_02051 [Syntrophomonadaceae bacterium]|nr:hypothetical protein [Bacillota bacterium]